MDEDSSVPLSLKPPPQSAHAEALLAKFREEWKAEVRQRKLAAGGGSSGDGITQPHDEDRPTSPQSPPAVHITRIFEEAASSKPIAGGSGTAGKRPVQPEIVKLELTPQQQNALDVYKQAVACEQRAELDEALQLYRRAFRSYENVDRLYTHLEKSKWEREHQASPSHARTKSKENAVENVTKAMEGLVVRQVPGGSGYVTGALAEIVAKWDEHLRFEPEEGREAEPVPIGLVPDEILVHIITNLDLSSLERFATVNRKTRVLTLDSSIWRSYVQHIYQPPQIPPDEDIPNLLSGYLLDYRRMFIEHPRIRLDGVYIAVLHYTRKGLSENAWVNINHLITYHRYLRFYPDGTVLSLLANEEIGPQQVIPILKPSLRMKGFYIGNWRLSGTEVVITDLTEPSPASFPPKYTFQMRLDLKSRPTGRWNRLNFLTYENVAMDGEVTPLLVKHDRPFWFSKVRSYGRL
ncbi:hypothetical protein EIP91_003147 [Steccherinum ochraceum]|uniref:F-box domain-containing protein n=1 Tax=Steccherinum ochraceum TaxID=92696 RepID=A0A4R0S494_9APHY|nr:hypothetical protein EIP91_003147 [Steccherinum ochraceum]